MLPTLFARSDRRTKVRILPDNSVVVRGNMAQVYRPSTWR